MAGGYGAPVTVRAMEIGDLAAVYALGCSLFNGLPAADCIRHWSDEELAGMYAEFPELCFVAVRKKQLLGFMLGEKVDTGTESAAGRIVWLGISPEYRHLAAGDLLFDALTGRMKSIGVREIWARAGGEGDNDDAGLYARHGFIPAMHRSVMRLSLG